MLSPAIVYECNDNDIDVDLVRPNNGAPSVVDDAVLFFSLGSTEDGENGLVTAITNASPPVVTSAAHGLANDTIVIVHGVRGATLASGTWMVKNVTTNTFELYETDGVTPAAAPDVYSSGGVWRKAIAGAYALTLAVSLSISNRYSGLIPATADIRNGRTYVGLLYETGLYAGKLHVVQNLRGKTRNA